MESVKEIIKDKVLLLPSDCDKIIAVLKLGKGEDVDIMLDSFSRFTNEILKNKNPTEDELKEMVETINGFGRILSELLVIAGNDKRVLTIMINFKNDAFKVSRLIKSYPGYSGKLPCTIDIDRKRVVTDQLILSHNELVSGKTLLLIIDMQQDFANLDGSLYVKGGEDAETNLIKWIGVNREHISEILLTRDDHYPTQIGMYLSWMNVKTKRVVEPFTEIKAEQVRSGEYVPRFITKERALEYLDKIESLGSIHKLWTLHCIHGSKGQQFSDNLITCLKLWSVQNGGKHYKTIDKGSRDDAEMYSVFSYADKSNPEFTKKLLDNIAGENFDKIFIAGLAKDICVASSVKDLVDDGRFKDKLVFLTDCMASINNMAKSLSIYEEAKKSYGAIDI